MDNPLCLVGKRRSH